MSFFTDEPPNLFEPIENVQIIDSNSIFHIDYYTNDASKNDYIQQQYYKFLQSYTL
jgi:hypothetical protein